MATMVTIAVDNNAAPLVIAMMMVTPEAVAVMVMTAILLTTAPANITISWTMTMNDDNNDADIGNDNKDSLPLLMMATTAEMTIWMMGGGSMWRGKDVVEIYTGNPYTI
jgi:hypothetical protein